MCDACAWRLLLPQTSRAAVVLDRSTGRRAEHGGRPAGPCHSAFWRRSVDENRTVGISQTSTVSQQPAVNDAAVDGRAASDSGVWPFGQPLVVDIAGVIHLGPPGTSGVETGPDPVPEHVAKDLTPAQIQAYRLADTKRPNWPSELRAAARSNLSQPQWKRGLDLQFWASTRTNWAQLLDPA